MSLVENNSCLSGFSPGIRTLHFSVSEPEYSLSWSADDADRRPEQPSAEPRLHSQISGVAALERDHFVVIGSPQRRANSVDLHIVPFDNTDELSREWHRNVLDWGGDLLKGLANQAVDNDGTRTLQFMRNVYDEFAQRIPTAFLSLVEPDWELGWTREEWHLECRVPRPIVEAVAADVRLGSCESIQLSLKLAPTLLDDPFAPPAVGVNVGLLPMGKYQGVFSYGWLEFIKWSPRACRQGMCHSTHQLAQGEE